MKMMIFIN